MALYNIIYSLSSIILFSVFLFSSIINVSSIRNQTLESGKVCGINSDKIEFLLERDKSSVLVITANDFFASWTGRYRYSCVFTVRIKETSQYTGGLDFIFAGFRKKREEGGIYAVIQDLNFRKNSTTGECIDYIQFRKPSGFFKNPQFSKTFCGFVRPGTWFTDSEEDVPAYLAPNAVTFNGSAVDVEVYASNLRLDPGEKLVLSIVFTAFHREGCGSREMVKCSKNECIWKGFKNDGYQNCPYRDCADEDGCIQAPDDSREFGTRYPKSSGIGTKVTIGAVACILTMLLVFAACLCICKRLACLCFDATSARRAPMRPPREVERVLPSAPPEIETKDLPPSYDSLFPTQS